MNKLIIPYIFVLLIVIASCFLCGWKIALTLTLCGIFWIFYSDMLIGGKIKNMIIKKQYNRVYNEMDPYGEEDWIN